VVALEDPLAKRLFHGSPKRVGGRTVNHRGRRGQELILDILTFLASQLFLQHSFIQKIPSDLSMIKAGR
jgi:hypothetical protein